ncbi:MAG: exodeoxyribonuclease III [Spirochaetales bacterium]|nr:exodeoxyribonuclease III [Spirochaetales bacterium]
MKLISWNVNGIRAVMKKGFAEWLKKSGADIVCLQEVRANTEQIEKDSLASTLLTHPEYRSYFVSAEKKGYSGVGLLSRPEPGQVVSGFATDSKKHEFNKEGRVITADYGSFELWNIYFPNGGRGDERIQYKLDFYEYCLALWEKRRKERKLVITGDFNTAHKEIDLARPKENRQNTGFLPEECAFLDRLVEKGYVDTFRLFNQEGGWYTYWDQVTRARERNVGWRIDYFWVTQETLAHVQEAQIFMDVPGSDHCPLSLTLRF